MKKNILAIIFFAVTMLTGGLAFADRYAPGDGYDPNSPGDPDVRYLLELNVTPNSAGSTTFSSQKVAEGTPVYINAYTYTGYNFEGWYDGETLISSTNTFYYTMPAHSVKLTAKFGLEPVSPGDPMLDGYTHSVKVIMEPSSGGYVSTNNYFLMREGDQTYIYAYPNSGFKFNGWRLNGENVTTNSDGSLKNPLLLEMEDKNIELVVLFNFAPDAPADPFPNSYNRETFELIVDNFQPGNLQGTIDELISDRRFNINRSEIHSLIIAGRMDNSNDSYFAQGMTECTLVDLARTSGMTDLTWYHLNNIGALTEIILPSSLENISSAAFYYTPNMASITSYATIPPVCNSEFFDGFTYPDGNIATGVIAKVPASSLSLYREAPGWKHLSLVPIESEDCFIQVNLPIESEDGRYKGMNIILENPGSGQTQKFVINDRTSYMFENLVMNVPGVETYYNVYLRTPEGDELYSYSNIFLTSEHPNEILNLELSQIKSLNDLTITVLQDDGKDVASSLNITWSDSQGDYVASGTKASGIIEGKELTVNVSLTDTYGAQYQTPESIKVVSGQNDNKATLQLEKYPVAVAEGVMTDAQTGKPIVGGYVTIEQTLCGKFRNTATGVTDKDGIYHNLQYINHKEASGKVTARAEGYVSQPRTIESFETWEMSDFEMKPISGATVSVSLLWKAAGENESTAYAEYANVDFSLYNTTKQSKISNFSNQYPLLVILDDTDEGDEIEVTAESRTGVFETTKGTAKLDSNEKGELTLSLKEHGKIATTYSSSEANNVSAVLYDQEGILVKHMLYDSKNSVSFVNLPEGSYTLVVFADSPYFTGFASLSDLEGFEGFDKGEDYLMESCKVVDGEISKVDFSQIPKFDESQFYKADPAQTLLKVNKTSVTASNYVTLSTRFDFLSEYRGWTENVKLVYELPEHVSYVKNSLINGDEPGNLTSLGRNKYEVVNVTPGTSVRFIVMPEKGGNYYPTATLEFDYQGTHYTQPLGSFYFQGVDFKLYVPRKTARESVWARGVASNSSDVTLFVNGAPLSSAKANGSGDWLAEVPLKDPQTTRIQQIYGEIVSTAKGTFPTESALVEYDPYFPELNHVRMVHNGTAVDFIHPKAKTTLKSYSYNPSRYMFSLLASFDENKERVKEVNFHILSTDGSERVIDAVYSTGNQAWVAALDYPDSYRLPVNVTVDFTYEKPVDDDNYVSSYFFEDYIAPDVQPIIDPSGYVYEAEENNRIEGATVTIFYHDLVEDATGEENWEAIKWDATEYGQENPLITDKEGLYGWDVPQGQWQVKYEKKGYETAYSEWLDVPPPQLDVNMNLIRNDAPYVKEAHAYDGDNGIEIIFDHYMDAASLEGNIYILKDNAVPGEDEERIAGKITPVGNSNSEYVSIVRFIPDEKLGSTTDEVHLIVARKVTSYSGIEMVENYEQYITIEKEITAVGADEDEIAIEEGQSVVIRVSATPADAAKGKKLHIANQSEYIINFVDENNSLEYDEDGSLVLTLDENGQANVTVSGEMIGQSQLDFSIDGSNVTGITLVDVQAQVIKIAKPIASIPHQSVVYKGVLAELTSKYPDGVIYYTLDGSDPTPQSLRYTTPIKVDKDVTLKAIVVTGNKISEIAEYRYIIKTGLMDLSLNEGWSWISHNMETPVEVSTIFTDDVKKVLSQTSEAIYDEKYGIVGNLKELSPYSSYKVQSGRNGKVTLSDAAYNPETPITLNKGWNWIGYPVDVIMTLDEAFAEGVCENGDVIETIGGGSATYKDGEWIGDLTSFGMNPGVGYLYYSISGKSLTYDTSKVTNGAAKLSARSISSAPWVADKYLYPSLMPIVADVIKRDGTIAEEGEYSVAAFCGSECRGVGVYDRGYLFLTVHGNPGEEISFRIIANGDESEEMILEQTLAFTENPVGSLESPYQLNPTRSSINSVVSGSDVNVEVKNRVLYVRGNDVQYVGVYDLNGNKILSSSNADTSISLEIVNVGVHVIAVKNAGNWTYHKVMIK